MNVIPPIDINDTRLSSSTVSEPHAPANYNGATTYGNGAFVTDSASGLVYQSKQASNTGHAPDTSPDWWEQVGFKEVAYNSGTTYAAHAAGAPVYVLYQHRVYVSLQAGNTGHTPYSSPLWWQDVGPSMKYAMFDTLRGTATYGASPLVVEFAAGERIDSLAMVDVIADSVRVELVVGGITEWDSGTIGLVSHDCSNWYEYFFFGFRQITAKLFQNIPPYTSATVKLTFTRATGNVAVGAVGVGMALDLGKTQKRPTNEGVNFSRIEFDDFGNPVLIRRGTKPKTNQLVVAPSSKIDELLALRSDLDAKPAFWFGTEKDASPLFPALLILGVATRFDLEMPNSELVHTSLELRGI